MHGRIKIPFFGAFVAILFTSLVLRTVLVLSGGQYFFPDEVRYEYSISAANALWSGNKSGFFWALHSADHPLFKALGVIPASLQLILGSSPRIPALFFSMFSVLSIALIWSIAIRVSNNRTIALLSAFVFSLSSSHLYFSRHLLPYDASMAFALISIYVGFKNPTPALSSLLSGLFASFCVLTYTGYWVLGGCAMLIHVLQDPRDIKATVKRILLSSLGLLTPLFSLIAISTVAGGNLLGSAVQFSGTVTQGSFSEGWTLPIAYYWQSEGMLSLLWLAALLFGIWDSFFGSKARLTRVACLSVLFIYVTLVIFSVFFEKFVVYGRLTRQLIPFFSILTAVMLAWCWEVSSRGKEMVVILLLLLVGQSAWNFKEPFFMTFPNEFLERASRETGERFPSNKIGSWSENSVTVESNGYQVWNAHYIYPEPKVEEVAGTVIFQTEHPQNFRPFQYESFTPSQRRSLRLNDIRMKLVRK